MFLNLKLDDFSAMEAPFSEHLPAAVTKNSNALAPAIKHDIKTGEVEVLYSVQSAQSTNDYNLSRIESNEETLLLLSSHDIIELDDD